MIVFKACNFIKIDTPPQVFPCEFYKISKNTFFYRTRLGDCFWSFEETCEKMILELQVVTKMGSHEAYNLVCPQNFIESTLIKI